MSEIEEPDEDGGIDVDTGVSFIVVPARKGIQAAAVKIADPPKEEDEQDVQTGLEADVAGWGFGESGGAVAEDAGGWGTF
ncbi:hypothetical protein ACLMJK_000753 [Lecanora helva]